MVVEILNLIDNLIIIILFEDFFEFFKKEIDLKC